MPEAKDKAKTEPVYKAGSKSKDYRDGYRAGYLRALKIKKSENGMADFNRVKVTNDGQWYKTDEFVCSNCGLHLEDWCARDREGGLYEFFFVYCPFCGGKVEEE